jgi:hypothetical protein
MPEQKASLHVGDGCSSTERDAAPVCLSCGQDTHYIRTIPNQGVLPETLVFQCPHCHSVWVLQPIGVRRRASLADKGLSKD